MIETFSNLQGAVYYAVFTNASRSRPVSRAPDHHVTAVENSQGIRDTRRAHMQPQDKFGVCDMYEVPRGTTNVGFLGSPVMWSRTLRVVTYVPNMCRSPSNTTASDTGAVRQSRYRRLPNDGGRSDWDICTKKIGRHYGR